MKYLPKLLILALVPFLFISCGKSFTPESFSKVQPGMQAGEVGSILGKPSSKDTQVILGRSREIWHYRVGKATYAVTLVDGKVASTSGNASP